VGKGALVERGTEVSALAEAIDGAFRGEVCIVLVEGEPGIGKSALLAEGVRRGIAAGLTPLRARSDELERESPFGLVRQLLEPVVARAEEEDRAAILSGAARLALPALQAPERGPPLDPHAALHGLYWLTANLAERTPLLLSLDDLQWADTASLRFLLYVTRRAEGLRLVMIAAARDPDPARDELLRDLALEPVTVKLRPQPLSAAGADVVLTRALGREPDPEFLAACSEATGGNPFLLQELGRYLAVDGVAPVASHRGAIAAASPAAVADWTATRLARLTADARQLAEAVAVLGRTASLGHARNLSGLEAVDVTAAAAELASAGIVDDDLPLTFIHSLVRAAVYGSLPAAQRADRHAAAARVLAEAGAPSEQVVGQLMQAPPAGSEWVVERLAEAADTAAARGAPDAAAALLRRALEEPPDAPTRLDLLRSMGRILVSSGDPRCVEVFQEAVALAPGEPLRSEIAGELAPAYMIAGDFSAAVAVLEEALGRLGSAAPELALRLEAEMATIGRLDARTYPRTAERLRRLESRLPPDHRASASLRAPLAVEHMMRGGSASEVASLVEPVLEAGGIDEVDAWMNFYDAVYVLIMSDRFDSARRALDAAMTRARDLGLVANLTHGHAFRAELNRRIGDLPAAEADGRASLESALAVHLMNLPVSAAFLCETLLDRGDVASARETLEQPGSLGGSPSALISRIPNALMTNILLFARARLRLVEGDPGASLADLGELTGRKGRWRIDVPAWLPWRSTSARSHLRLGNVDEARRLAAEEVELAEAFGAPRALGIALRAHGLALGGAEGLERLRRAVEVLGDSGARLEHARALADLGGALRRANQRAEAREPLREAVEAARACGAVALAQSAHEELRATGARPRSLVLSGVESLTARERQVAELAAEGLSNPEIAQALFVTRRTVETHLGSAYRKLDIGSRQELATALGPSDPA
jgi:DNA-binding CsgD family transcriptional regulator